MAEYVQQLLKLARENEFSHLESVQLSTLIATCIDCYPDMEVEADEEIKEMEKLWDDKYAVIYRAASQSYHPCYKDSYPEDQSLWLAYICEDIHARKLSKNSLLLKKMVLDQYLFCFDDYYNEVTEEYVRKKKELLEA